VPFPSPGIEACGPSSCSIVTASGSVFSGASIGPSFVSFDALRPEIRPIIVVVVFLFFLGIKKYIG
jgi:hypothetical protein